MLDGEREWFVAKQLAEESGEPVHICLEAVKRLGWELVGTWLFDVRANRERTRFSQT